MDFIKKCLGFVMLIVALVVGFYYVSIAAPFEFMEKYIVEDWFIKLGNFGYYVTVFLRNFFGLNFERKLKIGEK